MKKINADLPGYWVVSFLDLLLLICLTSSASFFVCALLTISGHLDEKHTLLCFWLAGGFLASALSISIPSTLIKAININTIETMRLGQMLESKLKARE